MRPRPWAQLICRTFEVYPLVCPRYGRTMRIVVFITESKVIGKVF